MSDPHRIACLLFEGYETLDMMGPVEMFGMYPETFDLVMVAESGPAVSSDQGPRTVVDATIERGDHYDILLVPGGAGTRREVDNTALLDWIAMTAENARYVTSVCTGSVLLARAGVLAGRRATTNKRAFDWVASHGPGVTWVKEARWVEDGNILTASGVSAGMDMSLALIARILGQKAAEDAALWAEYTWHRDRDHDPFAHSAGLI